MPCQAAESTAATRERELYRYYQPVESPTPLPNGDSGKKSATDPVLTAFAQLGALRCNAKRGLITLSSSNTEYILAESGQHLSLQKDDDEGDKLWHGEGKLTKQTGMGPPVSNWFSDSGRSHLYHGDLTQHSILKDKPTVIGPPYIRAIAAVPLKTPVHGIIIGTYILLDDKVRDDTELSASTLEFLQDMSVTIMDYLESKRLKKSQHRAERMVKAIGLLIEGKSSLREWWMDHGHQYQQAAAMKKRSKTPEEKLVQQADREFGVQEVTDYFSVKSTLSGLNDNTVQSYGPTSPYSGISGDHPGRDGRPPMPRGDTVSSETRGSSTLVSKAAWHERNSSTTTFETFNDQIPDAEKRSSVSFDLPPALADISKDLQDAVLSSDVRAVFARSSNLIREAIGVEGVLYYDASVGSFGGSSEKSAMDEKAPGAFDMRQAITSSEDDIGNKMPEPSPEHREKYCNVLGFSTRSRSSLCKHAVSEEHNSLPESVLRKLLKRYPHGKVFIFDENGTFSESITEKDQISDDATPALDDKSKAIAARKIKSRDAEAKVIMQILPGARSVFFFPLWDQSRERWFSGSFVWSMSPSRTLCPVEDITYLAAFGNTTMAEIIKISAAVLSKMKTDFISSISHELRSPLHGVLASVEFLQETEMTEVQEDMVQNIQASGKVLLDTINHVLDFSKVNRKTKKKRRSLHRTVSKQGERQLSVDDTADEVADICVLSEEVLESIYAGRTVGKTKNTLDGVGQLQRQHSQTNEPPITIIVDIQWRSNWTFLIDPGAWRRVLMNIFSNALKYTKIGLVQVSMEIEDDVSSQRKLSRSNLTLKVKDSGKGITQEFLRHSLYKPFTQEDTLATGAGLGLSIVKAIVQDLGGRIDFTSEPGSGTEVTVRIPLNASSQIVQPVMNVPEEASTLGLGSNDTLGFESLGLENGSNTTNEVRAQTKGLRFSLSAFDRYPDIPTGILSAEEEAAMLLKASVQTTLTTWFDMQVTLDLANADVVVIMESGLGEKSVEEVLQSYPARDRKAIAIVLTSSYHLGPKSDSHCHFRTFYLQQPNGPHKFVKILHQAFCQPEPEKKITTTQIKIERPGILIPPASFGLETKMQDVQIVNPQAPDEILQTQILLPASATYDFAPVMDVGNLLDGSGGSALALYPISSPAESPGPEDPATPRIAEHVEPVPAKELTVTVRQENGMRVLLVEDNEINLKLLVATMQKLKLDHVTATNGLEALNSYKDCNGNFHVIFMDISMPVMSGIESSREIRRFERENNLEPVALIALTGAANPSTRQEAFSSGVDLYLTKPVPMKALRGMLDDLKREGRGAFAG